MIMNMVAPITNTAVRIMNMAMKKLHHVRHNQTQYIVAGDRFYDLLASEITNIRCFDAVRVSPFEAHLIEPETDVRNGRYSEKALVKLRDIYNVDAIMFTSLKDFRPYWPPRFSATPAPGLVSPVSRESMHGRGVPCQSALGDAPR